MSFEHKKILIAVTGSIATYKACELVRSLIKLEADVQVVMSSSATRFVSPLTFQALSGKSVRTCLWDSEAEAAMDHIELARWPDMVVVAPASANCIAKLVNGCADDLLSTLYLATSAPVFIVPAMNQAMWSHIAVKHNVACLKERGVKFLGPAFGLQACGDIGEGRMMEPSHIVSAILPHITASQFLRGKRILLTAGPTREAIDPVRYLTNKSSGKMGYALASAATLLGADVTLISGPAEIEAPGNVNLVNVITAEEMHASVHDKVSECDIFICVAAVADYRCYSVASTKIKKNDSQLTLRLVRNPDIVSSVASLENRPIIIAFAAETENVIENAKQKLLAKGCDIIVANDVSQSRVFDKDESSIIIVSRDEVIPIQCQSKSDLSVAILEFLSRHESFSSSKVSSKN